MKKILQLSFSVAIENKKYGTFRDFISFRLVRDLSQKGTNFTSFELATMARPDHLIPFDSISKIIAADAQCTTRHTYKATTRGANSSFILDL